MAAWEVILPAGCIATLHPEPPAVGQCPCWFCVRECLVRLGSSRDAASLVAERVRVKVRVKELGAAVAACAARMQQDGCNST